MSKDIDSEYICPVCGQGGVYMACDNCGWVDFDDDHTAACKADWEARS